MIQFENVSKRYPDGTVAVDSVDIVVPAHSVTVFAGSSGSGKTTLLRMINRMVEPTAGRILIDGEDTARRDPVALRRSIGYVMQNTGLLPHRTVEQNIALVPRLVGMKKPEAAARAREMMELVGLEPGLARRYPQQLSGGQAQRVGVARGLATRPNILLMDEPFGAVDPLVRQELQAEVRRLHHELGTTIVFVTHDMDEALALGDQVILFRQGAQIAQQGTGADLLAHPADDFVRRFVGGDRADRTLHVVTGNDGSPSVVVDGDGRPAGVLDS